ncbi:Secreted effector protein pipB2 [Maioricimonas rarisocia]|uniref:Secreted effector protein pipB2 n=1 Tax=Maioricimonas rarisocia TaxID=2528026 RepID=A0A517Z426_9PLAN|nr:pentapeptide repeat-containing protein [Maioricimonas rarisocia]QDU37240.1 Secreted effector protein pipB2 [Maioricimonas rarisocia]
MSDLSEVLRRAFSQLPEGTQTTLRPLVAAGLLEPLAQRLLLVHQGGGNLERPRPHLEGETTPPVGEAFAPFRQAMQNWETNGADDQAATQQFVSAFATCEIPAVLVLLGQRTTSGSVVDGRAFPPARQKLVAAAGEVWNGNEQLTAAARALSKHCARCDDPFWGELNGNDELKNGRAQELVAQILDGTTWWNVFVHFQHGLVYEARVETGHGARWTADGQVFIGFVDPFDASQRIDGASDDAESSAVDPEADLGPLPDHLDRQELQRRYALGQRDFRGADLSGVDLKDLDLQGIDLTGGSLVKAKLFGTNLEGAVLTECDLGGTYLAGTRLSGATARRAQLRGCRMDRVSWRNVDFEGARLDQCNLRKAELTSCSLRKAGLADADLTEARLVDVRAYGAFTEGSCWHAASLEKCRFNNGRIAGTDFSDARFENCNFEGADLANTNCTAAQFVQCEFKDASFNSADLSGCSLEHACFDRAAMAGARLEKSCLSHASLGRANLSRANLRDADLSHAKLVQADLSRADLRSANLKGAELDGADMSSADVVETEVDESTSFEAARTIGVDFGTNWSLRQRVLESAHDLTIRHFRRKHPVLGFMWWLMLGCGKRSYLLLLWGIAIVVMFAGLMAVRPDSFDFGQAAPTFWDHMQNSLAVFVTLDLAVDKGTDAYGRGVMLVQMLLSYLMLGFMASLFSGIFPSPPE